MPFPSSEEGLESLLVIQPHLSWSGGGGGGGGSTQDPQQHQWRRTAVRRGEERTETWSDCRRLQETPGDPWRPLESGLQLQLWDNRSMIGS